MSKRVDKAEKLYDLLLDEMEDRLTNGDEIYDGRNGEHIRVRASASTLRVVAAFLKDAGVEATEDNQALSTLMDKLKNSPPDFGDDTSPYHVQ